MALERQIVLVGRPNVGKSRLFNRLAGKRISIVHDMPGVTRDIVTASLKGGRALVDTGGLGLVEGATPEILREAVEAQVFVATGAASQILFILDGREGLTPLDEEIASGLRRSGRPVRVVVNKCDNASLDASAVEMTRLGFGDPFPVSAEHDRGIHELQRWLSQAVPPVEVETDEGEGGPTKRIGLCIAGKPNVGKSSLTNRLLAAERVIVSDVPGTTRDAVEFDLDYRRRNGTVTRFRLHDTAGLRAKRKVDNSLEYFSALRTRQAVERSDVVVYLLDALTGATKQDQKFAGEVIEAGKGLVLAVNKWDLALESFATGGVDGYQSKAHFTRAYEGALRKELFFLPGSPVVFLSARDGLGIEAMIEGVLAVQKIQQTALSTGPLNRAVRQLVEDKAPNVRDGKRFKLYYAVQTGVAPIRFKLFCNDPKRLDENYRRYLEKGLTAAFGLDGAPLQLKFVGKPRDGNPYVRADG